MIIGHQKQRSDLEQILQTYERGAFLLRGVEGLGKFSLIKSLAYDYAKTSRSELIVIDPDEEMLKLSLAHLVGQVTLLTSGESKRIILINDAHRLTHEAQAALLKPIEDVLSKTLFFLVSHRPLALSSTIRSRCQIINFQPLPFAAIVEFLAHRFKRENLALAQQFFPGQVGRIITWLEQQQSTVTALRRLMAGCHQRQDLLTQLNLLGQLEKNSDLRECVACLLSLERQKLLSGDRASLKRLKVLFSLYGDTDAPLNQGLQLSHLCFNLYG